MNPSNDYRSITNRNIFLESLALTRKFAGLQDTVLDVLATLIINGDWLNASPVPSLGLKLEGHQANGLLKHWQMQIIVNNSEPRITLNSDRIEVCECHGFADDSAFITTE